MFKDQTCKKGEVWLGNDRSMSSSPKPINHGLTRGRCWLITESCSRIELEHDLKMNRDDEGGSVVGDRRDLTADRRHRGREAPRRMKTTAVDEARRGSEYSGGQFGESRCLWCDGEISVMF
ncbi:unnamed protein product [Brassica rapa subsp. narinosa]